MNIKLNTLGLTVCLLAASFFSGSDVSAQTTTSTYTFTNVLSNNFPLTVNLSQFSNPYSGTLGQLTSVQIGLINFSVTGSATVKNTTDTNPPPVNEDVTVFFSSNYTFKDTLTPVDTVSLNIVTGTQSWTGVTPGTTVTTNSLTGTQSGSVLSSVSSANWADYIPSSTTPVVLSAGAVSSLFTSATSTQGNNANSSSGSTLTTGTLQIIYTYTAVPEPRETAGMFIGFAVLLLAARKYFRSRNSPTV